MEEFNCRGKVSSMTLETVHSEPGIHHEEQRLFKAKLFYDGSGLLIRKQEPRKITYYHHNDEGLLEREVEVRSAENISRERIYHYSADRLLSEVCGREKITYHYNSRDVLGYTTTWISGQQESICTFGYDQNGRTVLKEIRDPEGVLLRSLTLERDPRGLVTSELLVNQDNMILEHTAYKYPVFHKENWLKRESWIIREGKEPRLSEILYRNITMEPSAAEATAPPEPTEEESITSTLPEDTSIALPGGRYQKESSVDSAPAPDPREKAPETPAGPAGGGAEEDAPVEKRYRNGHYKGSINAEGLPHGKGEFWGRDGSRYSGTFSNGRMDGRGNLLHKNGSSYTGEFKNGFPHGKGECLWPDGSRYRGQFARGEMHGLGAFTWSDGARFTGLFEHNSSTDQGLLENADLPDEIPAGDSPEEGKPQQGEET